MIVKALAFVWRDFLMATSYKASFAAQVAGIFFTVPVFYYISEGVAGDSETFVPYGGYFAFLLIGLGLLAYHAISLRTFSSQIRESQMMGTLEIVLTSPTGLATVLVLSSLWVYLFATIRFTIFVVFGTVFGLELEGANLPGAILIILLAIPGFAAFGIASAALIVVIKRGDFINAVMSMASLALGGVLFPVEVLPGWAQQAAWYLPITHALQGMREAFAGASIIDLREQIVWLAVFAIIALPISVVTFWIAVRRTRVTGTLSQY